jgi:N-methylhydantoinase B
VVTGASDDLDVDTAASADRRAAVRAGRPADAPFFDRGPGYAALAGGRLSADVDRL